MSRKTKDVRRLECILTDEEKLKYSQELGQAITEKRQLEDSLKSYQTQAKAEITGHDANINLIAEKLKTGKELRDVECKIEYDFRNKKRAWIRLDTFEVCKEDIIPEEDLQEELAGTEK